MIETVQPENETHLDDYAAWSHLRHAVEDLRTVAARVAPHLEGRRVWMLNSTAQGGGVAEMLPKLVGLLRTLGVDAGWVVMTTRDDAFFALTKRLHNLIHDAGEPGLRPAERACYAEVSRRTAAALRDVVRPRDVLVVHDPQPAGAGALVKQQLGVPAVWRCHIGLDVETPRTRAAWQFLAPHLDYYDRSVFSVDAYVPPAWRGDVTILPPAIDPLGSKNRELSVHKLTGVLTSAGLTEPRHPVLTRPFVAAAQRVQPDGTPGSALLPETIGLRARPVVTQVSRWDRLKGFEPLLDAFVLLKREREQRGRTERHRRRLELVRLVLAGPDPASVQDDPEGVEVFQSLCRRYAALDPALQREIAILLLPMASREENALMVNVLQRCSTVVVQNSLQEGFGLTATEAMWKRLPVLGTHAVGLRTQIRDGIDGCLVPDAEDAGALADVLDAMLEAEGDRVTWGRNGQLRVAEHYLVLTQVRRWLELLADVVAT